MTSTNLLPIMAVMKMTILKGLLPIRAIPDGSPEPLDATTGRQAVRTSSLLLGPIGEPAQPDVPLC
jgi:hypothetical protein